MGSEHRRSRRPGCASGLAAAVRPQERPIAPSMHCDRTCPRLCPLAPPAQDLLAADGRWGVMQEQRWAAFLDWLSGARHDLPSCGGSQRAALCAAGKRGHRQSWVVVLPLLPLLPLPPLLLLPPPLKSCLLPSIAATPPCRQRPADHQGAEPRATGGQRGPPGMAATRQRPQGLPARLAG